jgi:anti-sigma B factor antagonist
MRKPQEFTTRSLHGLPVVSAPGEIDIANAHQLQDALSNASTNAVVVVADMAITAFCDSSGMHVLVSISEHLHDNKGELRIVCNPPIRRNMALTGHDRQLRIYSSLPEALARKQQHSRPEGLAA